MAKKVLNKPKVFKGKKTTVKKGKSLFQKMLAKWPPKMKGK